MSTTLNVLSLLEAAAVAYTTSFASEPILDGFESGNEKAQALVNGFFRDFGQVIKNGHRILDTISNIQELFGMEGFVALPADDYDAMIDQTIAMQRAIQAKAYEQAGFEFLPNAPVPAFGDSLATFFD